MASETVADLIVATLKAAGVERIFGVVGDSLNGLTDALRRNGTIAWLHMRHEEAAAFAASAEAQLTGTLAVCAGSCGPLMLLAETLKAPTVHALGGKEHVAWDNPFDVGMTRLIGFSSGYHAMEDCDVLLMLGTGFPYRQFFPPDAKIAQVDLRPENVGRRCRVDLGLVGDVDEATFDRVCHPETMVGEGVGGA